MEQESEMNEAGYLHTCIAKITQCTQKRNQPGQHISNRNENKKPTKPKRKNVCLANSGN